jgi:hypothetical protein
VLRCCQKGITIKIRSIKLTRAQEDALREAARAKGVSDSFMVREALDAYLAEPVRCSSTRSAADAAAHLIGTLDGTPADLSTNPKHHKGFGS